MLRVFAHFLAGMFTMFIGFALWLAPHIDWSRVKDESLWSVRGWLVLSLTTFCFAVHMFALLATPKKTVELKVRKHKVK